jgi:hypothetical protein
MVRRVVLVVVVVVVVVLIAVLVNSCEVSARNSTLEDYNNSVASLNAQSANTAQRFFGLLAGPISDPVSLQNSLNAASADAVKELNRAKALSTPDEVKDAQMKFVLAMQMRADGIKNISAAVPMALQSQTTQGAVNTIAAEMAKFYASDVLYKDYTVPEIIGALRAAGIQVGGLGGQQVNSSQFLPSIQWLTPSYIADQLHVTLPQAQQSTAHVPACACGHAMQTVSVGGTTLTPGSSTSIPASPPPTFTCVFTNDGQQTEHNVKVKVAVQGTQITGQAVVPQTSPGQTYTAQVQLSSSPPKGTYTVTATVVPVPGEYVHTHNTQTFTITFQ